MKDNKSERINIRIAKDKKAAFYAVCEMNGLCPSRLIERWINRFINNSKKNKIDFLEVKSINDELEEEYNEYRQS